jgi:hypothetical protein
MEGRRMLWAICIAKGSELSELTRRKAWNTIGFTPKQLYPSGFHDYCIALTEAGCNDSLHWFLNGAIDDRPWMDINKPFLVVSSSPDAIACINTIYPKRCFGPSEPGATALPVPYSSAPN